MSRPRKDGIEYFPHFVNWGMTIPILESKYGNDGYSFWFKLLEQLGKEKGHFIDCNDPMRWNYLLGKCSVSEVSGTEILDTLALLSAIDSDLWTVKVIWSQNFVENILAVYTKRKVSAPVKPDKSFFCDGKESCGGVSVTEGTQSIVEHSRGEESRVKHTSAKFVPPSVKEVQEYLDEQGIDTFHAEEFVGHYEASGWKRGKDKIQIVSWRGCVATWVGKRGKKNNADELPRYTR